MIAKELDPFCSDDPKRVAGRKAEEDLAFHLRRAFEEYWNIVVFNGVRLVRGENVAQIDHFVLHEFGVILIEGKSVAGEVRINEREEWSRGYNGHIAGMESPILQVCEQAHQLLAYLRAFNVGLPGWSILVAISDSGIISRPRNSFPNVCKADQVPGHVRTLIDNASRQRTWHWTRADVEELIEFFLDHHTPLQCSQ